MLNNTVAFVAAKLIASSSFTDPLSDGRKTFVRLYVGAELPEVIINRTHELFADGLRQAVILLTCRADSADIAEEIGERVVDSLHGVTDFSVEEFKDIEFQKGGVDVTSWDAGRYFREIEFVVTW
jgi:hypothetical protein